MYFVESGTLVVLKTMGHEGDEKAVNEVQQGEYFGELALVNHAPRAATVAAKDDVRVACKSTITIGMQSQEKICSNSVNVRDRGGRRGQDWSWQLPMAPFGSDECKI